MFKWNIKETVKTPTPEPKNYRETWKIDKQFSFCYGHRVWSQKLDGEYCESGDTSCKCRALHGHEGLVHLFLEAGELERGMVTDFKHLGWLKNFLDDNLDHKFIVDLNDPWFANIVGGAPMWTDGRLDYLKPTLPLNTSDNDKLIIREVFVPGTEHLAGWILATNGLSGPEQEVFEGFFFVNFVPTSENFSKWIFDCVDAKMSKIGVTTAQVDWFETPKSRSSYRRS